MDKDKLLKKRVEDELEWTPDIDAAGIGVAVDQGVVTLTGHVATYSQKLAVEETVRRIKGVRAVAEEIELRTVGDVGASDEEIAKRVANLLEWHAAVPTGAVKAQVSQGIVTLSGQVEWHYQRLAAERGVAELQGVRGLENQVTVKPLVRPKDVQHEIERALERQADLEAERVVVTVKGGVVRLEGALHSRHQRRIVEDAAWAAPGVYAVDNRTTVQP